MRCVHPVDAWRRAGGGVTWNRSESTGLPIQIRCGQCIGCRLARSRDWAVRLVHEAQMSRESGCMFLTLTYDDVHVPADGSLDRRAMPLFFKRLRRMVWNRFRQRVRYFQAGEYGESNMRPHYHAAVFGVRDPERYVWKTSASGFPLYRSPMVEEAWPYGFALVGEVDLASAQYVAGYVTKKLQVSKMTSEVDFRRWEARYERLDMATGEMVRVEPEFSTCSLKPGLGERWLRRYWRDVYPSDEVVIEGKVFRPPRYYDVWMEREFPDVMEAVKRARVLDRDRSDDGEDRLEAMEKCALARSSLFGGRSE